MPVLPGIPVTTLRRSPLRSRGLIHVTSAGSGATRADLERVAETSLSLEQQQGRNAGMSGRLYNSPAWRDLWYWLDKLDTPRFVEADAFVVRYMPLADGARRSLGCTRDFGDGDFHPRLAGPSGKSGRSGT